MRKLTRTLLALFAGALIALLTIAALFHFTDPGRRVAARLGFWTAGQLTGYRLACGSFTGNLFSSFICRDFALSDRTGVFFRGRELALDWRLSPLLNRQLFIDSLRIADAVMTRPPEEQPEAEPFTLPEWPRVRIGVTSLALERITLQFEDKPPLCFGGGGTVTVARPVIGIDAQFARCGGEGSLRAVANYDDGTLMIDTAAVDDGTVAQFLFGWQGAGASELRIAGSGPLTSFTASLDATVRDGGSAVLRVQSRPRGTAGEFIASAAGRIELAEGRAPRWAPARDGEISVLLTVTPRGGIRADQGTLRWGPSDIRFQVTLPEGSDRIAGQVDAMLGSFGTGIGFSSGELHATLQGTRSEPGAQIQYRLNGFHIEDDVETVSVDGQGTVAAEDGGARIRFSAAGDAENLTIDDAIDAAIGTQTAYNVSGTYGGSALALEGSLDGAHADLTFDTALGFEDRLSGRGTAQLTVDEMAEVGGIRFGRNGTLTAELDEITGARTSGTLQLDSPLLAARGPFTRAGSGELDGTFTSTRVNPALLSQELGLEFAAQPSIRLTVGGRFSALVLDVAADIPRASRGGIVLSDADLALHIARERPRWNGEIRLTSSSNLGPVMLAAVGNWGGGQPIHLALGQASIAGAPVIGDATAARWRGPWQGTLTLRERPLAPFAALTGRNLTGGGTLAVAFSASGERQTATADIAFTNVNLDDALNNARVEGRISYLSGGISEARLAIADRETTVTLAAAGAVGDQTRVTINTLEGEWRDMPVRLTAPATITADNGGFALSPATLEISGGRLQLVAQRAGEILTARAALAELPVEPIAVLLDWPSEAEGRIDGTADISFAPATAQANVMLTATDLAFAGEARGLEPADIAVSAAWNGSVLTVNGQITGLDSAPAQLTAAMPLVRTPGAYGADIPERGPVTGRFTASARAERLFAVLPLPEHRLSGALNVALAVSGDVAAPDISGRATLSGGSYESLELGTRLRNLELALDATADGALAIDGRANDGGNGRFALTGRVALMGARATVNANLQTQNADLVRTDEYTARGTANLAIARGTEGPARVTGTVRTTEVRFDLGQPPPGGVEEIAVIEVNRPPDLGAIVAPDRSPEVLRTAELSIDIDMPDRVFVVGYGVNAEWRGDVSVRGTLDDPVILGQLALVRGDAEVLGRQFELEQGLVTIDPFAPGNARIRIVGANVQPGLTVRVTAEGSAATPRLEWTSTPALPRDEILSRLYFGRASPSLNAYEAVQLAQLSGFIGGFGATGGVLGFARRVTGLDVLRLEAPVAGTEGGPRVAVGKYVTDRIYVGAVSGAETSSSALQVEVQITPNISVQVETGADARQAAGVLWQRDY